MASTKSSKKHAVLLNGLSDEEEESSGSQDEMKLAKSCLGNKSKSTDQSSSDYSSNEDSSSEDSSSEDSHEGERHPAIHRSKKKKKLHWKKKEFSPPSANFIGHLPPPPDEELTPIDYFFSMFGHESVELLTQQSNLYSVQSNPNKPLRVTLQEMQQFIGILIMTGIYSFPNQRFFWANDTRVDSIASTMSRDRFFSIKKNLHVVDNSQQLDNKDPNFDRAHKVRPLLNIIKNNFRNIPKEEKLSADEQIIPFKGRSIMKQYMPQKPNRWGYKMFLLAGAQTGICFDFIFFTGKNGKTANGFCTDIILQLCETVPNQINHKLFFDNYYTTIKLLVELYKLGIFATGTIRSNRLSDAVLKNEKELSKDGRGSMDHRVAEIEGVELCITRWYDNNVVNCLSTLHGCHPINLVQRWSPKEKTYLQITQPHVIKSYNQYMGGVDLIDMLISLYRIDVRCQKYYHKIIFHLMDLSVVNAWLLYRRHCSQVNVPKKNIMSLLSFRISIAESLLKSVQQPLVPQKRGRPSSTSLDKENRVPSSSRATPVPAPSKAIRFDNHDHWPMYTEKGRCRHFGCSGYSRVRCSKCKIRLCINERKNCFISYHQR